MYSVWVFVRPPLNIFELPDYLEVLNFLVFPRSTGLLSGGPDQWISSTCIDSRMVWWSKNVEWCPNKYPNGKVLKNSVNCVKIISKVPKSAENGYLEVLNIFGISQEQRSWLSGGGDHWISSISTDSRLVWWSEIVEWWPDRHQKPKPTQKPQDLSQYEVRTASEPGERSMRSLAILNIFGI